MASVQIAAAGTGNGTTAGVAVTEARCYDIQVVWNQVGTAPGITLGFSVDGTNYFTPALTNISQTAAQYVYKVTDTPVTKMRITVDSLSTGTISAYVSAV